METEGFMTASEFAEKINTPYPTVAAWLREGRVPGAELQQFGNTKFWMIPVDVLRDFIRPKKGRPLKAKPDGETGAQTVKGPAKKTAKKKGGAAK